jgi:hypothetical protein
MRSYERPLPGRAEQTSRRNQFSNLARPDGAGEHRLDRFADLLRGRGSGRFHTGRPSLLGWTLDHCDALDGARWRDFTDCPGTRRGRGCRDLESRCGYCRHRTRHCRTPRQEYRRANRSLDRNRRSTFSRRTRLAGRGRSLLRASVRPSETRSPRKSIAGTRLP